MFGFFLELVFRSIKLDKKLYREVKTFSEVSIYFAAIIMILDGVAGAIATNNFYKTSLSLSALTAILTWFFWAVLIFTIGAKIFPDKDTKVTFKKILIAVMPIIPHFSNECLSLLGTRDNIKWPNYDKVIIEEDFVNIVVQINGKKRGLIKTKKNIQEDIILENIKKEKNIMKHLNNLEIKKKIYIQNKLINIIV